MTARLIRLLPAACVLLWIVPTLGGEDKPAAKGPGTSAAEPADLEPWLKPDPAALRRWQDMRFGMFIHWGPVSIKGTEIGWSRGGERRGTEVFGRGRCNRAGADAQPAAVAAFGLVV